MPSDSKSYRSKFSTMSPQSASPSFTQKQGQYLAFIYAYTRVFGRPPAEADLQRHFRVSPPSVHQMVLTLERAELIRRQPGVARSIEVLILPSCFRSYIDPRVRRRVLCWVSLTRSERRIPADFEQASGWRTGLRSATSMHALFRRGLSITAIKPSRRLG